MTDYMYTVDRSLTIGCRSLRPTMTPDLSGLGGARDAASVVVAGQG